MTLLNKDELEVKIFETRAEMAQTAAFEIAEKIKTLLSKKNTINMIFAAAPSQSDTLSALIDCPNIPWNRINAFHMDEYVGLPSSDSHSFGYFLSKAIFDKVPFKSVNYIKGDASDIGSECDRYSQLIKNNRPDIVIMGIGENGHIAFNDPDYADFKDDKIVKTVFLDQICRNQQVNDGCFKTLDDVPKQALTLTIPALIGTDAIFCIVPAATKANAVKTMLNGDVSETCPASILRTKNNAVMYLDDKSSSLLTL